MASTSRAREARVDLTVGKNKLERGLRDAKKSLRGFAGDAKAAIGGAGKRLAGGLLGGLGLIGGLAGGLGLESTISDVVSFERAMTRLQIATDATPEKMAVLRSSIDATSRASGIAREQLLAGASAYVALTGDADGAKASVALFAKVANATGASMEDIAATAAAMKDNLKIDPKDFEAAFSALSVQGKEGAVELRELASLLSGIAPSFAAFKGGAGAAGLAEMGAALQVVRKGFGSSSEAATGLRALMVALNRNADKFKSAHVNVFEKGDDGVMRLRNFSQIIDEIGTSKLATNPTLLTKAFGSDEAARAYQQLTLNRDLLGELIQKSQDKNAIDRDAATYQQSAAGRMDKAMNALKLTIAEIFTPERLKDFVAGIESVVDYMGRIVGYIESITGSATEFEQAMGGTEHDLGASYGQEAAPVLQTVSALGGRRMSAAEAQAATLTAERRLLAANLTAEDLRAIGAGAGAGGGAASIEAALVAIARNRQQQDRAAAGVAAGQAQLAVVVKIGEEAIAKAEANAKVHRTKPGGV